MSVNSNIFKPGYPLNKRVGEAELVKSSIDELTTIWNVPSTTGVFAQAVQLVAAMRAHVVAIAPNSFVDRCVVQAANGPKLLVSTDNPYPPGRWEGPFKVWHARKPWITDVFGTWSDSVTAATRPYHRSQFQPEQPLSLAFVQEGGWIPFKRPRRAFVFGGVGPANPAALAAWFQMPMQGRKRASCILLATGQTLEYRVMAVHDYDPSLEATSGGPELEYQIWPAGAGTRIIAAGAQEGFTVENENICGLRVEARHGAAAGASGTASFEVSDD